MNRLKLLGALALVMLLGMGTVASDALAATIVIVNNDGAGEGFNDPTPAAPVGGNWGTTVGQQRLIAFEYAAGIWGACLDSNVPIQILAQFDPLTCTAGSAILGSAGAWTFYRDFGGAPAAGTWYSVALANSLAGVDLDPAGPDIDATFNSNLNGNPGCLGGTGWYYGLDGNPGSDIDFVSVLLHEMGHGLGFQTLVSQSGAKALGYNDQYMIYLENHGAVPADYPSMSNAQRAAGNIADPNLHWTGPLVTAEGNAILTGGVSGGHVRMHGPNPYQPGSSVSHFSTALTPNELMEPSYTGANSDPGLAWTLMEEIGWNMRDKLTDGCDTPNAPLNLAPPTGTYNPAAGDDFQDRGVFVTAIKRFDVCSIGIEGDFIPGETLTANIYAANGTTRGALLATASVAVEFVGMRTHYIPINYQLQDCEEYDIAVQWDHATAWPWWNENTMTERPYDVGGAIRVRDGELFGDAGNFALAHFTIQGSSSAAENQTNLLANTLGINYGLQHGVFMVAEKTQSICALGINVVYTAPGDLRAYVYEASMNVRGALVAEGTAPVPSAGGLIVTVPINAVLVEGREYNVGFEFSENGNRSGHLGGGYPYDFAGLWTINSIERNGLADANVVDPAFRVSWSEGSGGNLLDLSETFQGAPPLSGAGTGFEHGMFMTANVDVSMYSFGIDADFPAGATLTARVYSATGTGRGSLITEGTIATDAGDKWHDVPLAVEMVGGNDYEVVMTWNTVNLYEGWSMAGLYPINAYGLFTVLRGSFNGGALDEQLLWRVGACTNVVTGIAGGPTVAPKFTLAAPYPNPVSGSATLGISLDEAASVTVAVYDVKGRKVADLVQDQRFPVGPAELTFHSANLPSGVYFVKMSTPTKSVSRKITIVR